MKTFRFERTNYGYRAFARRGDCFVYFGHFYTQRAAREAWAEATDDCAVIWSVFCDAYIIKPLPQVGPAIDLKYTGTREQCAAWIAQQR